MIANQPTTIINSTLSDHIYDILQEWILTRKIPMGERLDFGQLEQELGVSRTPLSEAVARLEADGLVTSVPRKGKYVTTIRPEDVRDRFEIRQILETGAVDHIIRGMTEERCERIMSLCQEMAANNASNTTSSEYIQFIKLDAEFHREIIAIAGSQLLIDIYNNLLMHQQLAYIFIDLKEKRMRTSIMEHEKIAAALLDNDALHLEQAFITHLTNSKEVILNHMKAMEQV